MGVMDRYNENKKKNQNTSDNETKSSGVMDRYYKSHITEKSEDTTESPWDKYKEFANSEEGSQGWLKYLADQEASKQAAQATETEKEDEKWWEKIGRWLGSGGAVDTSLPMGTTTQVIHSIRDTGLPDYTTPRDDWTNEQRNIYGYLYSTNPDEASKYAEYLNTEAKEKAEIKKIQDSATSDGWAGVAHTAGAIATAPMGLADFLNDLVLANAGVSNTQYDGIVSPFEYSQAVTEGIGTHLNEEYGTLDEDIPIIGGKGWGDVYGLGTSIAQSAVSAYTLGGAGTLVSYFGQGAASGVDDALSRGATEGQALLYGTALGTFEGVAEMIGIDNLFKIGSSATLKEAIKNVLKQAGAEGMEEGLTSILGNIADVWIMQDKSNFNVQLNEYMSQGMSETDAKWKVFWDSLEGIAFDTIGGFVSGGVHAGAHTGVQTAISNHNASKLYGNQSQALVDEALGSQFSDVKAVGQKYKDKLDSGKKLSGGNLNKLIDVTDTSKLKSTVLKRLGELGETSDVTAVSDVLIRQAKGEELSSKDVNILNNSKAGHIVSAEMNKDNIKSGGLANKWAENIGTRRISPDVYNKELYDFAQAVTGAREAVEKGSVAKTLAESEKGDTVEVSDTGKTMYYDAETDSTTEVNVKKVVSTKGGIKVELGNGKTVSAKDLKFGTQEEGLIYEMVARMEVSPETANELITTFKPKNIKQASMYFTAVPLAYRYGQMNYKAGLKNIALSDAEKRIAFNRGRADAMQSDKVNTKSASKKGKVSAEPKSGIIFEDGFVYDEATANELQKASMAGIEVIDKMSNLEVHVFRSKVVNGKRVAYVNGKLVKAPNGYFKDGNKIYIDFEAGNGGEGAMLYTMSHEVTHYIRKWNAKGFRELGDFLIAEYGKHGVPVNALLEDQKDKIKKRYKEEGKTLPSEAKLADTAYEELVADAMSDMFTDPKAYEKLAKLKQNNRTLWEKLGEAIKAILDKLKSALGIYKTEDVPVAREAFHVRDFSAEAYNKLQDLYIKAFVEADANYEATIGSRNLSDFADAKNENGEPLLQYRAMEADEAAYREMLYKWGKMSSSQIDNLFDTIDNAMELIKDNLEALDYAWEADIDDRAFSPVKPNSDKLYQVSLDFSTLCRKRILQQTVQAQLQEALNKPLSREEGIAIRDALMALQEEGRQIEVACALCYVESARMKSPEQIKKFINNKEKVIKDFFANKSGGNIKEKIKQAEADARARLGVGNASLKSLPGKVAQEIRDAKKVAKESYKPTAEEEKLIEAAKGMTVSDFTSPEGLENLAKKYPRLFDAYTSYIRNATKSKGIENDTWWRAGDSNRIGDVLIANMNKENGLRTQSWSDFQVIHILDYIASTIELATRNTKEQAYSKVPDYVELMGLTGVMINMSLIPTAKFNGSLDYDSAEGIDYKRALELRNKYHATAGTICIGVDNVQIKLLLADTTIDYVIPYHRSGMSKALRKLMHIPTWSDYELYQSEPNLSRADAEKQAKKYGVKLLDATDPNYHKGTSFSEWFDLKEAQQISKMENANPSDKAKQKKYGVMYGGYMAMQNAANNYLKLCAERGISPKFSHEKADFTIEENYWKLLIDRKMVDNVTGEVIEQQNIKPIFKEGEIMRILNDEVARYPKVKEDQDYAIRRVTEKMLSGEIKGGMSAEAIAKVMKKPVDNVTNVNILASAEDMQYSVREIVGDSGKNYGIGVYLDSQLLTNLTDAERIEMVKEYVKELGGSVFTAYDSNHDAVDVHIVESNRRFKTKSGKNVPVYHHMLGYLKNEIKQEAIALVDELIVTSTYRASEPSNYPHGWVDNNGANDWESWTTYLQDKENTVWEATLKIANSANGEKILYEIYPIKMVEQSVKPDTSTTDGSITHPEKIVKGEDENIPLSDRDSLGNELTAEQEKFFKDSKARDEQGNLLVLYHGTSTDQRITKFKTTEGWRTGLWLSTDHETGVHFARATQYIEADPLDDTALFTKGNSANSTGRQGVYELYANVKNPLIVDAQSKRYWEIPRPSVMGEGAAVSGEEINVFALENGYDGVIINDVVEGNNRLGTDVIVFSPNQVKYTDNLNPTEEDDIRFSGREIQPITETEYKDLEKHFGVTANFRVAGYLLPDGKMLDFSGKHWGDTTSRSRQVDHRDAQEVLQRGNNGINDMVDMIGSGCIRLMPEVGGINLATYPNEKQRRVLSLYIKQMLATEGQVIIDYDEVGGDTVHSRVYEKYASPSQILGDIRNYFNGARQSELMSFHTMYSGRDSYAPTFYSHMGKVIDDIKVEKMGAGGVVSYLKGRGVKDEEIKWSGIETFLEGKKSVTKAELQEFVAGSQLQIEETNSGINNEAYTELDNLWRENFLSPLEDVFDPEDFDETTVSAQLAFLEENGMDMPSEDIQQRMIVLAHKIGKPTRWEQYKLDGGTNYRELVFKLPDSTYSNRAMRGHWGQDAEGILVHTRVQDFNVDGKKMLFVEELQSDWHNEGHEKGYTTKEYEDAVAVYDKLAEDYSNKRRAFNQYVRSSDFRSDPDEVSKKKFDWLRRKMDDAEKRMQAAERDIEALKGKGMGDVPDAPFKNNYHEYVLKRLLRMAAEEGYDSIGWTPADIQSKRWSEDYAEAYRIEYDQDIPKFLRKYGKKWGATVGYANIRTTIRDSSYYEERIAEIESDIEQYRDELDDDNTEEYNIFVQEGISDLQNTLNELYKEHRGEKVWSMDISDSMKKSVLTEGQPLYSDRDTSSLIGKEMMFYEEGDRKPDLTLVEVYNERTGKTETTVKFVGDKPKNYIPEKIAYCYKLFEQHPDGTLHALFAGASNATPIGEWQYAKGFPYTDSGVKGMNLRERYGWHLSAGLPSAPHLMSSKSFERGYPSKNAFGHIKGSKRVWVRMAYDASVDFNSLADSTKEGDIFGLIPFGGYYAFKENNQSEWVISSAVKIDKILTEDERQQILKDAGYDEYEAWRRKHRATEAEKAESKRKSAENKKAKVKAQKEGLNYLSESAREMREAIKSRIIINPELSDVKLSDRDTDTVSNRSLLANALDSVAQNDIEKNKLKQYKDKIDLIESEQKKLAEIRAKIKELSFAKGTRDNEAIKKLQFEANEIANRINTYDKQLLNLESTSALKGVLEREKSMLRKRLEQKGKQAVKEQRQKDTATIRELMTRHTESRKKAIEGRHKTEMRHKIKNVVSDLNKLLLNPTKDQHVPIGLQGVVADALDAINMDTMNAEERVKYYNDLIAKSSNPDEIKMLKQKRDFFEYRDMSFKARITALKNAYAEFKESDDPLIRNAHNDAIEDLIRNTADSVGNKSLKDMSYEQLEAVYDMYKAVLATVRNSNKMFKEGRQETVTENSEAVKVQVKEAGGHKDRVLKLSKFFKKFGWGMLKPVTAMKVIGSKTLAKLFDNVRAAEDTWAVDVSEAKEFYEAISNKYGYNKWDFKTRYDFKDSRGEDFSISLEQMMSLYAYSKREQADEHLEFGGFIFDDAIEVTEKNKVGIPLKYEVNDANPHRLGQIQMMEIIGKLTQEQKTFIDEMQAYLSDVMGAKGNEVSLALYDIKLYKEKNYFPLKTSRYFREFDPEKSGTPKIKNSGFSKKTVPQAGNPIVLSNFMDVWASHVNDMSMYHAFVLPLEDFMRVYNYSSTAGGYDSVQQYIKNAYGAQANQYIEKLMDDLNGGARVDSSADVINKGISLFKKASVFASASVVVQQPSAIARAFAYINPKYFATSAGSALNLKKHKSVWAEIKKYAPVAVIKEMGYFDTGMGRSTVEWIKGNQTFKDKMDDVLSKAPAMADELSWSYIWLAVKKEIQATTNLTPGSDAFLKRCGERFTEIITNTQVYDSVLARSGMMRSKDTGMKMATAFMAEPTTTVNMMVDGIIQGKRGNKKFTASTVGAVSASIILNSILVALVYAARDDDEDETYAEKYVGSLTTELIDGFNPLTYIPFVKDVWSIAQGYDVERSDMSVVSKLWESVEGLFKEDTSGWEKALDVTGSISSLFGIPLKNLIRDAKGMYNLSETIFSDTQTTRGGIKDSVEGSLKSSIPLWDRIVGSDSKSDNLYDAIMSGDKVYVERLKKGYKTEDAYETAVRKALRENDSRIHQAAQARYDGDIAEYKRIAKEIIAEGIFSQDTVVGAINAEITSIKKGESIGEETAEKENEVTSIYKVSDINVALSNGNTSLALEIIEDLINTKVANGTEEKNARSSLRSSMTSYWKPLYKQAYQSGNYTEMARIRRILHSSGLYGSASDVVKTGREWLKD